MEFLDLYKNSSTYKVLKSDINANMLNHCYLISSKDSIFLHSVCMNACKHIMCLNDERPCNACINCEKIEHGNMVDISILPRDSKGLVVEDIIEVVSDCMIRAMEAKYKIYVLEQFDNCTVQAQNKLLKTLEEPPANVIFILSCTSTLQVLPTILSRSKVVEEQALDTATLEKILSKDNVANARIVAQMACGNLTIAREIAENADAREIIEICFDILENLRSSKDILRFSSRILNLKKDVNLFLDSLISVLRDVAIYKCGGEVLFQDRKAKYEILAQRYTAKLIQKILSKITFIYEKMEFNCNMTGVIDQMLLDILEVKFLCQN